EYRPNTCLIFLLRALRKAHIDDEELFVRCLTARYPDNRFEAILALRVSKKTWSGSVYPALERACRLEPLKDLEKNLHRLMEPVNSDKEQRYAETTGIKIKPSPLDLCLLETEIAGTQYRDLQIVEGCVEAGDILYLMREPENKYDHKAILVTADDGYVLGYVPRDENEMPAALMDNCEKLYAVFTGRNLEDLYPGIRIMHCKEPEKAGKLLKFPPEDSSERFEPQINTQRTSVPAKGKTGAPQKNVAETSRVILYESKDSDNQVIVEAYMAEGALHIDGHDLGKSVEDFWGEDEYEYDYSLSKEETEKLYELLKRELKSDKNLLELVAINFNGNECDVNFCEFCESNSIAVEFFSWF
ncbi:MAG: HIRAN domain-containing protein, partial [Eubacteriales bacterium]